VNDGVLRKITRRSLVFMLSALFPFEAESEFGSFIYVLALLTLSLTSFAAVVSLLLAKVG
jgi:hypothetical protein